MKVESKQENTHESIFEETGVTNKLFNQIERERVKIRHLVVFSFHQHKI